MTLEEPKICGRSGEMNAGGSSQKHHKKTHKINEPKAEGFTETKPTT